MKSSNFNIIIPTKTEGEYILANMMSGAVIAIDEEMKSSLEKSALKKDTFDAETEAALLKLGILLPDTADEYCKFKVKYETRKYKVDSPNFTLITTYACNLACPYCYEGKGELLKGTMNDDTRKRAVTFIKKRVEGLLCMDGFPWKNINSNLFYSGATRGRVVCRFWRPAEINRKSLTSCQLRRKQA